MARSKNPDLILLDYMLPTLDGLKICNLLKYDERYMNTPVIMISAREDKRIIEYSKEAKADAYLVKPLNASGLVGIVQDVIKSYN